MYGGSEIYTTMMKGGFVFGSRGDIFNYNNAVWLALGFVTVPVLTCPACLFAAFIARRFGCDRIVYRGMLRMRCAYEFQFLVAPCAMVTFVGIWT